MPTDYCYNITNKGKNDYDKLNDFYIFEYIPRGKFKYLGKNYKYNGQVTRHVRKTNETIIVGYWNDGVFYNSTISNDDTVSSGLNDKLFCKPINVNTNQHYIEVIRQYLIKNKLLYDDVMDNNVKKRASGKYFSFDEHLKALIYSLLSNQRKWHTLAPFLDEIDNIFFSYNADKILAHSGNYFYEKIVNIRCGNRNVEKI